jgi:predicted GNAT family acetyltransferase
MRVVRYTDLDSFTACVQPYLLEHEAEHCLPIGILATSKANAANRAEPLYMACAEDVTGAVALVALQTPRHNLVLSRVADGADASVALRVIATDARDANVALPGVTGATAVAEQFSQLWNALTGDRYRVGIQERIYQVSTVIQPRSVTGSVRRIEEEHLSLTRIWITDFIREALWPGAPDTADNVIASRLPGDANRGMLLWEDGGEPVSLIGFGNPTPHGIRIGPVYTPPELRGRGYASALVATVSQRLLDGGRDYCFLFTDLANPTSNHIYQEVGYEPVSDVSAYLFAVR